MEDDGIYAASGDIELQLNRNLELPPKSDDGTCNASGNLELQLKTDLELPTEMNDELCDADGILESPLELSNGGEETVDLMGDEGTESKVQLGFATENDEFPQNQTTKYSDRIEQALLRLAFDEDGGKNYSPEQMDEWLCRGKLGYSDYLKALNQIHAKKYKLARISLEKACGWGKDDFFVCF